MFRNFSYLLKTKTSNSRCAEKQADCTCNDIDDFPKDNQQGDTTQALGQLTTDQSALKETKINFSTNNRSNLFIIYENLRGNAK